MANRKDDEYNVYGKVLKYTSGVEHWKFVCPYCKKVLHIWILQHNDELITENDCKHYDSFNRGAHTAHYMKVEEIRRRKLDAAIKENEEPETTLFD